MVNVPHKLTSPRFWRIVVAYQFLYSMAGLGLGIICVVGGIILFFCGVAGSTNWTATSFGLRSNITDAAPGALLFIVGLFTVCVTRFRITRGVR